MKRHTPETAARAVRAMFDGRIAKTASDYSQQQRDLASVSAAQRPMCGLWLNSYLAAKLVQEQCNGPQRNEPVSFEQASNALGDVIPELFAEYWESIFSARKLYRKDTPKNKHSTTHAE